MRFLDSNIIAYAFYDNENTEKCQRVIREGGMINTFNLIEAFFIIEKQTDKEKAEKCIKSLLKSNIEIIDVDINLVYESLKRIKKYQLSIFDMIHFTCALLNNCDSFVSYDNDFNNLEISREEPQ